MNEPSDGALVARVLEGDRQAFGLLVDRHQDRMIRYVRHMGFGEGEAPDLVQDSFVRAYRHLRRCGDPERFAGWLFKIVSNVCKTAGARRSRRQTASLEDVRNTLAFDGPSPEAQAEARSTREQVRAALDGVPEDQREALVLLYLEGYSVSEIEELTGVSRSAVKMRLKRGRDALRERLGPLFAEVRER